MRESLLAVQKKQDDATCFVGDLEQHEKVGDVWGKQSLRVKATTKCYCRNTHTQNHGPTQTQIMDIDIPLMDTHKERWTHTYPNHGHTQKSWTHTFPIIDPQKQKSWTHRYPSWTHANRNHGHTHVQIMDPHKQTPLTHTYSKHGQ